MLTSQCQVISTPTAFFFIFHILKSEDCVACFPGGKGYVSYFLRWMSEFAHDDEKELVTVMQYKASIHKQTVVVPGSRCSDCAVLREFRT